MDKYALIEKINGLEGLSDEERDALTQLLREHKKYGLVWEDRSETVEETLRDSLPVLREVKDKAIVSADPDAPNHILIEGDNLEALTALTYTHSGKIDVIYIDPPYNTGNKDFVYNDSFIDKENAYRHSTWLSFMSRRLKIAKQLLSDKGVIFISIDDNEQAQLKLLCDEVFGESNFVGQWNWFKSATPPALSYKIKRNIEYVLAYEKRRSSIKYKGVQKISKSDDPMTKPQNSIKQLTFPPNTLNIKINDGRISPGYYGTAKFPNRLLNELIVENGTNKNEVAFENRFIWIQETLSNEILKGTRFNLSKNLVLSYKRQQYDPEVPPNLIDNSVGVTTTEEAGKELNSIVPLSNFDYPKPVSLLKYILAFKENSTVLDFFAGSGTTLHATMQLNKDDGGRRQCILVTNNENNICEEVTYVRNKRVIEGYTTPKGEHVEGLMANNLRYYKTKLLPREATNKNKRKLMELSTDLLCIKNNLYCETDEFGGKSFDKNAMRCFAKDGRTMLVVYNELWVDEVAERLRDMDVEERIMIYVFSMNRYPQTDNFAEVIDKVELCALPAAIYDAYKNVLPDREKRRKQDYDKDINTGGTDND